MNKRRLLFWILGAPILLILLIVIAVKIYFTDERLRDLLVPELEAATGRTVGLESISLSIFPDIGVSLTNFTLSNPRGVEFQSDGFLSVGEVLIDVRLMPLLGGTVQIDRVVLDRPVVTMEVTPRGVKNYSAGAGSSGSPGGAGKADGDTGTGGQDAASGEASPAAILLAGLEIRDGVLRSSNRRLDSRWEVDSLNADLDVTPDMAAGTISAAATWTMRSFSYGTQSSWYMTGLPLAGKAGLTYNMRTDSLSFTDAEGTLRDVKLVLLGGIGSLMEDRMNMDLTIGSPDLTVAGLLSLLGPDLMQASEGLEASGDVSLKMRVTGPFDDNTTPAVVVKFALASGRIKYAALPKSIDNVEVLGIFERPSGDVFDSTAGAFELSKFSASIGSGTLDGTLRVTSFGDPMVDAKLKATFSLAEVKDFYPLPAGTTLAGRLKADATMKGKVDAPKNLRASGTMSLDGVTITAAGMERPVRDLTGTVVFNDQVVEVKSLSMKIGESDLALDATVKNYLAMMFDSPAAPHATIRLTSRKLRTADIATTEEPPAAGSPAAGSPAEGGAPEKPAQAAKEKTGLLIPGMNSEGTLRIDSLVTEKFTFTNAKGSFSFIDGILTLKGFGLDAFSGSFTSNGKVDFRNPDEPKFDLDLNISSVESHEFLAPVTTFGQYMFGTLDLNLAISGTLDEAAGLDANSLAGAGNAKISNGKLTGVPALQSVSTLLSVPELKELDIDTWSQKFSVADGKMKIDDLKISAEGASIGITGLHGLDGSLDYKMGVNLPKSLTDKIKIGGVANDLLKYFKEPDGSMKLDFNVGGTVESPALSLNTAAQEERLKKDLMDKATKNLNEPVKNMLDGLKKLIKPKN